VSVRRDQMSGEQGLWHRWIELWGMDRLDGDVLSCGLFCCRIAEGILGRSSGWCLPDFGQV
jgi:hypothetical protein